MPVLGVIPFECFRTMDLQLTMDVLLLDKLLIVFHSSCAICNDTKYINIFPILKTIKHQKY